MEIYISCDIEADGPIPGDYSMSSFGLAVVGTRHQKELTPLDPTDEKHQFYRELKPISELWVPEAAAVSGLDRNDLIANGADPEAAMKDAATWIDSIKNTYNARPVFVAYPLSYDWMWMYWYFIKFAQEAPFGHSGAIDVKTQYMEKADVELRKVGKRGMPSFLKSNSPHTHNALDDAVEQGQLFWNITMWKRNQGN